MFTSIKFLSLDKMRALAPSSDTVVVSILDNSESPKRPNLEGWHDTLCMTFEDTYEENKFSSVHWPDEPTVAEHARFCQGKGERVPALSDAVAIVNFLQSYGRAPASRALLVHCYAGVSRSGAVALWAATRFFVGLDREPTFPNLRLLRLMDKASAAPSAQQH